MFWCFLWITNSLLGWLTACSNSPPQIQNLIISNLNANSWPWYFTFLIAGPPLIQLIWFAAFSGTARTRYSVLRRSYWTFTPMRLVFFVVFISQLVGTGISSVALLIPASQPVGWTGTHTFAAIVIIMLFALHLLGVNVIGHCYSNGSCGCGRNSACHNNRGTYWAHGFNLLVLALIAIAIALLQFVIIFGGGLMINSAFVYTGGFPMLVTLYSFYTIWNINSRNNSSGCNNSISGYERSGGYGGTYEGYGDY